MGKEIIEQANPKDVGKKILDTGRAGLLVITIVGVGLGVIDCAKKPSPVSQAPAGISGSSPQFPSSNNDRPLQSQQKKETPTPIVLIEKKSLSKTPEGLYRALVTAPLTKDLPSGMSVIGSPQALSSSDIYNNMAKSFGGTAATPFSGGSVAFNIDDDRSNPEKGLGKPNASVSFQVFTNNREATDSYNKNATRSEQVRPLKTFPYPALIEGPQYGQFTSSVYIESIVISVTIRGSDMKIVEQRTMDLAQSAIKHVQNVGN